MMAPAEPIPQTYPGHEPAINDPDVCLRCVAHQCELVCPTGCYTTRADGRMALDVARCVSCRACVAICFEFTNIAWHQHSSRD